MPPTNRKPKDEFCIARLVSSVGLLRVDAVPNLRAAKALIKRLAVSEQGEYVVFRQNDGRVLAKAGRKSRKSYPSFRLR